METKECPFGSKFSLCRPSCVLHSEKYGCAFNALPELADAFEDGFAIEEERREEFEREILDC